MEDINTVKITRDDVIELRLLRDELFIRVDQGTRGCHKTNEWDRSARKGLEVIERILEQID